MPMTSNMSAYYSSMLPPSSSLPGSASVTSQDTLYSPDGKYDPTASSFFNTAASNARYDNCGPETFPRYPPFERFDSMNTGLVSKPGYMSTSSASYAHTGLPSYSLPTQHGSSAAVPYDDPCKLVTPETSPGGAAAAAAMVTSLQQPSGSSPQVQAHHPVAMMSQFNPSPLSNMLNGMHHPQAAQNIPIYPWMRPMNGGEQRMTFSFFITIFDKTTQL